MKDSREIERVMAIVAELLIAEGMEEAAELIRSTPAQVDETGDWSSRYGQSP